MSHIFLKRSGLLSKKRVSAYLKIGGTDGKKIGQLIIRYIFIYTTMVKASELTITPHPFYVSSFRHEITAPLAKPPPCEDSRFRTTAFRSLITRRRLVEFQINVSHILRLGKGRAGSLPLPFALYLV